MITAEDLINVRNKIAEMQTALATKKGELKSAIDRLMKEGFKDIKSAETHCAELESKIEEIETQIINVEKELTEKWGLL